MKYYIKVTFNQYPMLGIYKDKNLRSIYTGSHCDKILVKLIFSKGIKIEIDKYIEVSEEIINLIDKIKL
jgi:hypothetical protein